MPELRLSVDEVRNILPLVPRHEVVATASGERDSEHDRSATYPTRLALTAAACADSLVDSATRAGVGAGEVLDLACGPAVISRLLLEAGAATITAVDQDPTMLAAADTLPPAPTRRLALLAADAETSLPFQNCAFDVVWIADFWSAAVVPEVRRVLRPNGRLVLRSTGAMTWLPGDDPVFAARIERATEEGLDAWINEQGIWSDPLPVGRLSGFRLLDSWTDELTWNSPVPDLVEEYVLQDIATFRGRFVAEWAKPEDWQRFCALADPTSGGYVFARSDAVVRRSFSHQVFEICD